MLSHATPLVRALRPIAVMVLFFQASHPAPAQSGSRVERRDRFGDPLQYGALYRIGTTRLQHGAEVRALAASPDGKLLAAASNDGTLSLWDVATGREVRRLLEDLIANPHGWLAFTPDGKALFCNRPGKLALVDVATGNKLRTFGDTARCGAIAADGKTATVVPEDSGWSPAIRRFDIATGKLLKEWRFQPELPPGDGGGGFRARSFFTVDAWLSAHGNVLATIETDRSDPNKAKQTLRLHEVATGKETRRWEVLAPRVTDLAFSADGTHIVLGSANTTQRVFEVATAKEVRRWQAVALDEHLSFGNFHVAMAPDGQSVFSSGVGGVWRWDWRTGKKLHTYPDTWGPIAFLNGGKAMAAQGYGNSLYVLDTATGKDLCPLPRPGHHVAFSGDGRRVAWSEGGAVVIADAVTGAEQRRWPAHGRAVGPLVFAPDGKTLASAGVDKHIRLWDVSTGKQIRAMPHEWVSRLMFSRDGKRLGSVWGRHEEVCVWDVATGMRRHHWQSRALTRLDENVRVVAVGDRAAKTLRLIDVSNGKVLHALPDYEQRVRYYYHTKFGTTGSYGDFPPLFSPDGRLLLAGGSAANGEWDPVYVWDVATGKRRPVVVDGRKFVFDNIAFSPDSGLLAVTRADCMLCLLDVATGEVVHELGPAMHPMTAASVFTPDGRTLITAAKARAQPQVQVWEVATGGGLCSLPGHRGDVDGLVVSGDGRLAATVASDHTILVWDLLRLLNRDPLPLETAWAELANRDAVTARRAIESLTAAPADAVALLAKRLPPVPAADPKQLARWIVELSSDDFEERRRATAALDRLGEVVGAELRQALAANPPLEARRRIEDLLRKHNPVVLPPEALRVVRAVQVLEMIGSPAARTLLHNLADGAAGARLTREARGTLERLDRARRSGT